MTASGYEACAARLKEVEAALAARTPPHPIERVALARDLCDFAMRAGLAKESIIHRAIVALTIEPDNHHSAEACPYCNPKGLKLGVQHGPHPTPPPFDHRGVADQLRQRHMIP